MSQSPSEQPAGGDAELAQAWREASRDEPAAAIDDAIRAAARKAVHARPRPAGVAPFGGRWRVPLSVAALVVVSATVTLLVAERDRHGAGVLHDQAAPAPAARAPQAEVSAVPHDSPLSQRQFTERAAPAPDAGVAPPREQLKQAAPPVPEERKRQVSPPPPASTEQPQAPVQPDARLMRPTPATEADRLEMQSAKSDQPRAAAEAPAAPPMARDDAASNAAAPTRSDEAVSGLAKREEQAAAKAKERTTEQAPAVAPQSMSVPAREPAVSSEPRAMNRAAPPSKTSAAQAPGTTQGLEPKVWLERIAELRRQGKLQEAEASLKAFRERYPDYPLPPELKGPP